MQLSTRISAYALCPVLAVFLCTAAAAQGNYILTVTDALTTKRSLHQQDVLLSVTNDATVQGWSFGVCNHPGQASICGSAITQFVHDLNPAGLEFASIEFGQSHNPNLPSGPVCAVVIDSAGLHAFPNNTEAAILEVYYVTTSNTAVTTNAWICDGIGTPPVTTQLTCCGGLPVLVGPNLSTAQGTVSYSPSATQWTIDVGPEHDVIYDFDTGTCLTECGFSVPVTIATTQGSTPGGLGGFRLELTYPSTHLTVLSVTQGATLTAVNGGAGPAVFSVAHTPSHISILVQNETPPTDPLQPYHPELTDWTGQDAVVIEFAVDTTGLAGVVDGSPGSLHGWVPAGSPTTAIGSPCGGNGLVEFPITFTGINVAARPMGAHGIEYIGNDCNEDGARNIGDPIYALRRLHDHTAVVNCDDACDANRDGNMNIADPVRMLNELFGGAPPLSPSTCARHMYPSLSLGCWSYSHCP